jgi:hypothetical protein
VESLKSGIASLIVLLLLIIATMPPAKAQTLVSGNWSASTYYQGDSGSLTFTIRNDHPDQICTRETDLQFDWQTFTDTADTPCIGSGGSFTFTIQFTIPSTLSVGSHPYVIKWVDQGITIGTQQVGSGSLDVRDGYEKVYNSQASSVQATISQYQSMNFQSPTAQSDLSQASSYYSQATSLAAQGHFQQAVVDLNQASSFASQAYAAEQSFLGSPSEVSSAQSQASRSQSEAQAAAQLTQILSGIGFAGVIVLLAFLVVRQRRRRKDQPPI